MTRTSPAPGAEPRRGRGARRAVSAALSGALALGLLAAAPAVSAQAAEEPADLASRFTLPVIPDTQFYSRYSADQFMPRYGSDPFATQTKWLAENQAALNIPFVPHLGDIVDQVNQEREWVAADAAMKNLENANVPYSILAGNHDVRNSNDDLFDDQYDLANEPFIKWFPPARTAKQSTFGGSDATGMNTFNIFEAEGQQYMVLALSWRASDATLAWADSVMDAHPTVPVILTTHQLINIAPDGVSPLETDYGLRLWDKLIKNHDQIFLTFNGHFHGSSQLTKNNDFGHAVTQVVIDYQMAYEGGDGYLGLYEFDLTHNKITAQTASPWVVSKPAEDLTSYDQAFLEGPTQQYTIDIDFASRFKGFNPDFKAGTADDPSYAKKARDILLDGFVGPEPISTQTPGDTKDFVEVDGTLAHWRFNGHDGVVGPDVTIPDVAGGNDLHRVNPADTNAKGSTWEDVTVETGNAQRFSSDGAGVCFADSDQTTGRFSYLSTAADAPVNNADFSKGFTIETFVKMDPNWDAKANGWSKFLVHTGNRSKIDGFAKTQWDWTASPTALGISNLREFQWSSIPGDATHGDKTAWSGEIMPDTWSHVVIVNDPAAGNNPELPGTITMYVDGAPVLRNVSQDALGMSDNPDMPWILGSDWADDAARNGWNGCIGETRIIDHPTTEDQWLTQRADLSGFTVTDAPTGTLPVGSTVTSISGTGLPGAEVRLDGNLSGTTTVDETGNWTVVFPEPLAGGDYEASALQALGTRVSGSVEIDFVISAADNPLPDPSPLPDWAKAPETGGPASLANTGTQLSAVPPIAAALLLLLGAVLAIRMRRRGNTAR